MTDLGLAAFVIYATLSGHSAEQVLVADYHYLTPFYSPCVSTAAARRQSLLAAAPARTFPVVAPVAAFGHCRSCSVPPDLLLLPQGLLPVGLAVPSACAVAEPHARTPVRPVSADIQNTHRYFFYVAGVVSVINTYDAIMAFHSPSGFGFGLGNLVLVVNVVCCGCTRCRATRAATSSAADSSTSPNTPSATGCGRRSAAEHPAQAVRVDHAGHADADRLLRHVGGQRHHH